jgi:nicotinamidase-related amidase
MIRQLLKTRRKQVIIDVNTQKDFFLDDGKSRVGNRRRILIHIRRLMAMARLKHIPVISISEVHPRNNGAEDYCIDGTEGQKKLNYTVLNNHVSFAADNNTDLPVDLLRKYHHNPPQTQC